MSEEKNCAEQTDDESSRLSSSRPAETVVLCETDQTCGGVFQTRILSANAPREIEWVPGAVYIVLKWGLRPERIADLFSEERNTGETDKQFAEFRGLLKKHGFLSYEPTFSFGSPGLPPEEFPPPGRDRYYTLHFSSDQDTVSISQFLNMVPVVEYASPVPKIIPPTNPAKESLVLASQNGVLQQWYVQRCRVDRAWNPQPPAKGVSGKGVVVADIDWGFRVSHQELKTRIERSYNSMDGTEQVNQGCFRWHGTGVLGMLGAKASGIGMVGFAYEASLWAIQAAKNMLNEPKFWVAAIDYVRRTKSKGRRKVICLEGAASGFLNVEMDVAINKAVRDAIACGVVVCVAAGNGCRDAGLDASCNPFPETGSILVGATVFDKDETVNAKAPFSNWGERVVVSAPGDEEKDPTCSSGADNGYLNHFGGTSGATPKVAGTVALMLEANPMLTHCEIRNILRTTGTHIIDAESKPIGTFLNAEAAVCEARRQASEIC